MSAARAAALAGATVSVWCCAVAGPPPAAAAVPASQPLVVLLHDHVARTRPSVHGARVATVPARRPLTGVRTVLPALGRAVADDGRAWVRVRLPGRPNGRTGWMPAARTRATSTEWRIRVRLARRTVTVYREGHAERVFGAVVGAPSTPTPRGAFFVEEAMALGTQAAGAPYALALSARSQVLQEFDGGPGQVALHGMDGLPGALGTASSHGCIRLSRAAITWLAQRIGGGVPITVTR